MSDNDDLFGSGLSNTSQLEEDYEMEHEPNKMSLQKSGDLQNKSNNLGDVGNENGELVDKMPIYDFLLDGENYLTKFPNFINVENNVYDEDTYESEACQDEFMDDEGRVRLKLRVGNTIRWRFAKDSNKTIKETNSRMVKWSDNSMTLHIGSEIFDVIPTTLNGFQNQLFIKQGSNLCCKGMITEKLNFKPSSTSSDTHKRVTVSLADRLMRMPKIQILTSVLVDPEKERLQRIQQQELEDSRINKEKSKVRKTREANASKTNISELYDAEIEELEKRLEEYQNPDDNDDIFSQDSDSSEKQVDETTKSALSETHENSIDKSQKRKKAKMIVKEEEEEW